jgi:hypothetical protein
MAQGYKMEISTIPEDKIFESKEVIQLRVTLYDSSNKLINDEISVILKDVEGTKIKEITIRSNNFEQIELTGEAVSGEGKIIVKYKDSEVRESFFIKEKKLAKFDLQEDKLIITNIGNTEYDNTIYITIGETTGTKTPKIDIGESVSYRLVAPEGVYNIKVGDGVSTPLEIGGVRLTGKGLTGKTIGILDEEASKRSPVTGGISPEEDSDEALLSYIRDSKFVYVFVLVILGAMILLAIEKRYRKKAQ